MGSGAEIRDGDATAAAWVDVSARAVILQGGHGTTTDARAQRIHRDSLVCRVAGGSPQMMRNVIAQQLMPDRRFPQRPAPTPAG